MDGSVTLYIDKITMFFDRFKERDPKLYEDVHREIQAAETILKFLKTFVCYTAKFSDEDKAEHLGSLLTEMEDCLSAVLGEEDYEYDDDDDDDDVENVTNAVRACQVMGTKFGYRVEETYQNLSDLFNVDVPTITDHLVFDQFVESAQEYLVSLSLELQNCFKRYDLLQLEWAQDSFSVVDADYTTTIHKLESFKYFIGNFAKWCTDEDMLQICLVRAGLVVLRTVHVARTNHKIAKFYNRFPQYLLRDYSHLSRILSPPTYLVTQIYGEVHEAYVKIMKAAKPSRGPGSSMASEDDQVESFLAFLLSAENKVDILSNILDFSILDLIDRDDENERRGMGLLKRGVAAVAREAGSLSSSIDVSQIPHVKPSVVLSKLLHKLMLTKVEIFFQELCNQKAKLMVSVEQQVAIIRNAFRFMTIFLKTPYEYLEDSEKLILAQIKALVREAGSLCGSFQVEKFTEDMILKSSLAIFKLFKAEAMLRVIIENNSSLKFFARYQIETFHQSLKIFRELLSHPQINNMEDGDVLTALEAMVSEATSLVCSFGDNEMENNQPIKMEIEFNFAEMKGAYQEGPSTFSNYPKSIGPVFGDFLLGKLRELLMNKPETIAFMKDQVEVMLGEVDCLRSFLKNVKQNNENQDLGARVVWLIYEAEYIVDLFVAGDVPVWYQQVALLNAIEETKLIKAQILEHYHDKERCDLSVHDARLTSWPTTSEASNPRTDQVIAGFDDPAKFIIDQLETGSKQRQIVSIVGMPGLGKTTLAKKVYWGLSIKYHFIVRAWCCVSEVYRKRELLLDLLGDFAEVTDNIKRMDDEDIARTLYQSLKGKRYLIVMDDIWSIEPWNELKSILPDDNIGSRILFTSRLHDLALQDNLAKEPYVLPFLSDETSWGLLQEELFHGGSCPEQLLEVGQLIAKNCKGLPLAIVVVAGLLKTEKRKDWWEEIAENLRSRIADDQERQFMNILEFSYNHLPSYLKPCFLYLGIFQEDQEIPVQKLKWLWIAEGFIPKMDSKSLEETAESYLVDLIGRSLVMEVKKRSIGGTKTCRMHDMLRHLCLEKAREENFMQLISLNDKGNSESHHSSDSIVCMQYRLCLHSVKQKFLGSSPFGPHVHSLLLSRCDFDFSLIPQSFKLLRVLDLECTMIVDGRFPFDIELMFWLNYLAMRGNITFVPSTIAKLWNLETLILKGTKGEIALPSALWSMESLRHVQANYRATLSLPYFGLENSAALDNLTTLSSPVLSCWDGAENLLRRLIGLKKLRCIFSEKDWNSLRNCYVFPAMAFLTQLESLKILYQGRISCPCEFSFPINLKKLTLSRFCLPWEYISVIRQLSSLEVLKLLFKAFEGQSWDMTGEFPRLKILKLENLNLVNWNASSDHFPMLQRLVVQSCKKLDEIPSSFGEIPTLQMIEMHWCSQSAAKSIETIYEQQLDADEDFKVMIIPTEWDFRASS